MQRPPEGSSPGDIVLRPVRDGYLIGRLLASIRGPGLWWEYIRTERRFRHAAQAAVRLATQSRCAAWIQRGRSYRRLDDGWLKAPALGHM